MAAATITHIELPGQLPQQQYGVAESGAIYLWGDYGSGANWHPENDAARMARESRAKGYRVQTRTMLDRNGRPNAFAR